MDWGPASPDDGSSHELDLFSDEFLRRTQARVDKARRSGDSDGQARLGLLLAFGYEYRDRLGSASEAYRDSLQAARDGGQLEIVALCLDSLGRIHGGSVNIDDGLVFLNEAMAVWEQLRDPASLTRSVAMAADLHRDAGRYGTAIALMEKVVAGAHEVGDHGTEWRTLRSLAEVRAGQGCWRDSAEAHSRSIDVLAGLGNTREEAKAWSQLAHARFQAGQQRAGIEATERACELFARTDDHRSQVQALMGAASTLVDDGRLTEGLDLALRARALATQTGEWNQECAALRLVARTYASAGQAREASQLLSDAAEEYGRRGLESLRAQAVGFAGCFLAEAGEVERAIKLGEAAVDSWREQGDERAVASWLAWLGDGHQAVGDAASAERCRREASGIFARLGRTARAESVLASLFEAALEDGRWDEAREFCQTRLEWARTSGSARLELEALFGLLEVAEQEGDLAGQLAAAERVIELARGIGNWSYLRAAQAQHMDALIGLGRLDEAHTEIGEWLEAAKPTEWRGLVEWGCAQTGIERGRGRHREALALWDALMPRVAELADDENLFLAARDATACAFAARRPEAALRFGRQFLEAADSLADADSLCEAEWVCAKALAWAGKPGAALRLALRPLARRCRQALRRRW